MKTVHFCSGLPRSGSTVLMNILQQNPEIFTTSTDTLPIILHDNIMIKSRFQESFQAMDEKQADAAMNGMVHGAFQGWYSGLTDKPIVISKNRQWTNVSYMFTKSKFLVIIRDIRDVIESFHKLNSKISALHSVGERQYLYPSMSENEKFNYFFDEPNAISVPLHTEIPRLQEMWIKDRSKVKFVRYEDFLQEPRYILRNIYDFLNLSYYEHDLNNIEQSYMFEHDHAYFCEKTSHKVEPQLLKWKEPTRLLSDRFHSEVIKRYQWFYEGFYPEHLK